MSQMLPAGNKTCTPVAVDDDPAEVLKEFVRQRMALENWIAIARRARDGPRSPSCSAEPSGSVADSVAVRQRRHRRHAAGAGDHSLCRGDCNEQREQCQIWPTSPTPTWPAAAAATPSRSTSDAPSCRQGCRRSTHPWLAPGVQPGADRPSARPRPLPRHHQLKPSGLFLTDGPDGHRHLTSGFAFRGQKCQMADGHRACQPGFATCALGQPSAARYIVPPPAR